jgi:hypothetical protein
MNMVIERGLDSVSPRNLEACLGGDHEAALLFAEKRSEQ